MGRAVGGNELGAKIVQALSLPLAGCTAVELVTPASGKAEVVVRYLLTREALAKLAESLTRGAG